MNKAPSFLFGVCILFSLCAPPAFAQGNSCVTDNHGRTRCAPPDSSCATNRRGQVVCTTPGGGMMNDLYGELLCGPGACVVDRQGNVVCSSQVRGGAALDQYGNAVCTGGCIAGKAELCVLPVPNK